MKYPISSFGDLKFKGDYWDCSDIESPVGLVDVQVDADASLDKEITGFITRALSQIESIDRLARSYLREKTESELKDVKLIEPSLLFMPDSKEGSFTVFYSSENSADETCYGVEFRDFKPFDITIGD